MKNILGNKYFLLFSRVILALVFIIAGIEKIRDLEGFAASIENYRLLPYFSINLAAILIPWIELTAGLLLLFGIRVRENSFIISLLMILFIFFVASAVVRDLDIECGCFGTHDGQRVGFQKLIENSILLLMGIQLYFFDSKILKLTSQDG